MPAHMRVVKAASIVGCAFLLLVLVSFAANEISFLRTYQRGFAFEPGPWFVEHVLPAIGDPNSCIVVGASTAREGFDPDVLAKFVPGRTFVNASTTGGNIEVAEIQAQILRHYGAQARCIVVGVHPFLMMDQTPPPLVKTGYLPHLGISDIMSLSDQATVWSDVEPIAQTLVLPLKTHSDRLNKLLRVWIFEAQNRVRTRPLSLSSYEYFADEFRPGANAHYDGTHSPPDAVATLTRSRYQTYTFNSRTTEASFKRALATFRTEASFVLVVTMPTRSSIYDLDAKGHLSYQRALSESNVLEIDCSKLVPDAYFIDDVHLDPQGRQLLSNTVGPILSKLIADPSQHVSCEAAVPRK